MDPLNDELVLEDAAQGGVLFGQPSPSAAGGDGGHRIPRLSPNLLLDPTISPAAQSHHQRRHSSVCSAFAPPPRRSAENNFLTLASKATAIATALGDPNTLQNTAWHGGSSFLGTGGSFLDSSSSPSGGPSSLHAAERRLSALQDHYTATLSSTTTASVLAKSNSNNNNSNGVNNSSNGAAAFDDRSKGSLQVASNARNHSKLVLSELSAAPPTAGSHGSPVPGEAVVVRLLHIPPECRGEKSISVLQRMVSRLVQLPYLSNGGDGSLAATAVPPPPMTPGSATMAAAAVTPSGSSLPLELTFLSSMDDGFGGTLDLPSNKSASGESILFPLGGNAAPPSTDPLVPLTLPVLSVTVGAASMPPSMSPSGDSGAAVIAIAQPFISKGNILQRYEEWAEPHGKVEREMVIRSILQSLLEGLAKFHRAGMAHGSVKLTNVFSLMDVTESIDALHGLFVGNGGGGLLQDDATREQQGLHAASRMQSFQNGHGRGERRRSNAGKTGPLLHGTLWAQQVLLVDGGLYERCEDLFLQLDSSSGSSSAFQQSSSFFSPTAKEDSVVPAAGSPLARSNAHELRYFSIATREYVPGPEVVQWTDQQQQEEEGTSARPDAAKDPSRIVHAVLDANLTSTSRCRTFLSKALDIWDVGLCAIQLADGGFPSWLRRQKMPVPSLRRGWWSRRFASFVESCLNVDPLKRPTVEELLADPWFQAPLLSPAPSSTVVSREASNPLRALLPMYGAHLPDGAVATHFGEERSGFLPTLDSTIPPAAAPRVYLRSMVDLMRTFQVAVLEKQFPATPLSSGRNAVSASVRRRSLDPPAVVVSGGPPMVHHHGGGGHSPRAAVDVGQRLSSTHTAVPSLLSTLTLRDVDLTAALQPISGDGERQSPPPLAAVDELRRSDDDDGEEDDEQPHQEGEEAVKDSEPTTAPIDFASLRLPRRRPCFVGGFAVAVDTTRRLILSASGLFAREDGIVVTIDPTTGEEHPLTPSQEAVVASIDSKCSALIGAMTDLASRSSLSADAWCASLLQHMARHSQWRPLVEPVVAEAALGGSALSSQLSVAQARPDAAKAMGGAAPSSLSSSLQEEDATPTQYNNFLFSKWHYSSRALLAEQQAK